MSSSWRDTKEYGKKNSYRTARISPVSGRWLTLPGTVFYVVLRSITYPIFFGLWIGPISAPWLKLPK